jgi:hypothetical protein
MFYVQDCLLSYITDGQIADDPTVLAINLVNPFADKGETQTPPGCPLDHWLTSSLAQALAT